MRGRGRRGHCPLTTRALNDIGAACTANWKSPRNPAVRGTQLPVRGLSSKLCAFWQRQCPLIQSSHGGEQCHSHHFACQPCWPTGPAKSSYSGVGHDSQSRDPTSPPESACGSRAVGRENASATWHCWTTTCSRTSVCRGKKHCARRQSRSG